MFFKIGVPKNWAIFTGKHLCWSLILIKLQAWRPTKLLKRDSNIDVSLWISRNLQEQLFYRTTPVGTLLVVTGLTVATYGAKYSRMDQVKFVEDNLYMVSEVDDIISNFLRIVFHKFYLVHSWIFCPIYIKQ